MGSSLIPFHRVLIAAAIIFCFGFAVYELLAYLRTGALPTLALAVVFAILGLALSFYLRHLSRFLKLPPGE